MNKSIVLGLALASVVAASGLVWGTYQAIAGSSVPGDANCDGQANPLDSAFILQFSAGLIASLPCPQSADANHDGRIDPLDSAFILQFSAGLIDSLAPAPPASTDTPTNTRTPTPSLPPPTNTPTPPPTLPPAPTSTPADTPTNTPLPTATSTALPPTAPAPTQAPTLVPVGTEAVLIADDGQFLGVFTCSQFDVDGIFNRFGDYGSRFSSTSIWNRFGTYGGRFGTYSPFNRFGTPPILSDGAIEIYLTVSSLYSPSATPLDLVLVCFDGDSSKLEYWLERVEDSS